MKINGEKLRELRKKQGLTQTQLADKIYGSQATIGHFESGRDNTKLSMIRRISDVLEVDYNELIKPDE